MARTCSAARFMPFACGNLSRNPCQRVDIPREALLLKRKHRNELEEQAASPCSPHPPPRVRGSPPESRKLATPWLSLQMGPVQRGTAPCSPPSAPLGWPREKSLCISTAEDWDGAPHVTHPVWGQERISPHVQISMDWGFCLPLKQGHPGHCQPPPPCFTWGRLGCPGCFWGPVPGSCVTVVGGVVLRNHQASIPAGESRWS